MYHYLQLLWLYYSERLSDKFKVQHIDNENTSAWAQYSILCNSTDHRDNIIKKLNKNKIPTSIFYIKPLHLQEVFKNLKYNAGDFKISEKISEKILCLPMHPYLKFEDIDKICDTYIKNAQKCAQGCIRTGLVFARKK